MMQEPWEATSMIADLLIGFCLRDSMPRGRDGRSEWDAENFLEETQLLLQSQGRGWKGYPYRTLEKDEWRLSLLGEVFGTTDSENAVLQFVRNPQACPLNGHFLLFGYNTATHEWHVWTDRFGTLHAYYAENGHQAAIGTFFPTVAAIASRRRVDRTALAGFFRFGFFPADRTYFEDVRIFQPASHYIFDENGQLLQSGRYKQWKHIPDQQRSYDDTVAEFAQLFGTVMDEMTAEGRIALPISGGLDSRSTVVPLHSDMQNIWSYSYGYADDSPEISIANEIAEARSLPFESFTITPYLFDRLDHVLASVEGFQDVTQCRQAFVTDQIATKADYLIAAHWGDVWMDSMGVDGMIGHDTGTLADMTFTKMKKRGSDWLVGNMLRSGRAEADSNLRDILLKELIQYEGIADPDFRLKAVKTDTWSFRWTVASLRMFQAAAFPRLPFYDARLADFFCTVPTDFVRDRRLQIDYIKRFAPDLARITWQAYDADLFRYQYFNSLLLPKRAVRKAARMITRRTVVSRNWEIQFSGEQGKKGLEHFLLRPGLRIHEYYSPDSLQRLLTDFHTSAPDAGKGYAVSMLLTFSAFLEMYG